MNEYLCSESQASGSFVYKFLNRDAACAAIESGAGAGVNWRQYWRQNSAFWRQNSEILSVIHRGFHSRYPLVYLYFEYQ